MLTDAAQKVARQQLQRSSPQCFLLPLATEHKQLLLLLLTEGLAVAYLKTEKVGTKTGITDNQGTKWDTQKGLEVFLYRNDWKWLNKMNCISRCFQRAHIKEVPWWRTGTPTQPCRSDTVVEKRLYELQ